jgi:TfoX/Sxy family transcriptional regulator of competence genes
MPKTTKRVRPLGGRTRPATKAMPKFTPAPANLVSKFESTLKDFPMAEHRKMFGYPAAFVNGHMFASLFQDRMMLRLPEEERDQFLAEFKTGLFEVMPGRPMKEYVLVPPALIQSPTKLRGWVRKALTYAQSLPPKAKAKKAR